MLKKFQVLFQGGRQMKITSLSNPECVGGWSSISQLNFAVSSESAVQCAVGHCHRGESPLLRRRGLFLMIAFHRLFTVAYNLSDFQARQVTQVAQHVELPLLCIRVHMP
jgi:hypothetical protein